ncbi:MAG: Brp/Blh family beta-carotene 15,15'-monooxygenase [Marivirga sp.]
MNKISFIFIAAAFLLLPLEVIEHEFVPYVELVLCSILIGTFGIAHGAIDNHLYGIKSVKENKLFIAIYVFAGLLFGVVWYLSFDIAFTIFLIISAYHFGQSQFIDFSGKASFLDRILYISWGVVLLSAFIYFNSAELTTANDSSTVPLDVFGWLLTFSVYILVASVGLLLLLLANFIYTQKMTIERGLTEIYQMFIIGVVFTVSSPLLGFTLYFVILHSIRVMTHEYQFFTMKSTTFSLLKFFKMLLPFTIISILGLLFFVLVVNYYQMTISMPLVLLIFISCLTLPHSLIMELFYKKSLGKISFS